MSGLTWSALKKAFCAVEIGNCSHCVEMILQYLWVSPSESLQSRAQIRNPNGLLG